MFPFVLGVHAIGSCIKFTIFDFGWWRHQPIKKRYEVVYYTNTIKIGDKVNVSVCKEP